MHELTNNDQKYILRQAEPIFSEFYEGVLCKWGGESCLSRAFLFLHGLESHSGWFNQIVSLFIQNNVGDCFGWDRYELRKSSYDWPQILKKDLHGILSYLQKKYSEIVIVGNSWGGLLATFLKFADEYKKYNIKCIAVGPGIFGHSSKLAIKIITNDFIGLILHKMFPLSYTEDDFCGSEYWREYIRSDPLRRQHISFKTIFSTWFLRRKILKDKISIDFSNLFFILGSRDLVIDNDKTIEFCRVRGIRFTVIPDALHGMILEQPVAVANEILRCLGLSHTVQK